MLARMGFLTEISGPPVPADLSARWIFDRLEEWAEQSPNRLAFAIDRRDGVEEHRYADVLDHVNAIVIEFQQHGIERGDKVGILMENIPQWVFVLLGAMRMGGDSPSCNHSTGKFPSPYRPACRLQDDRRRRAEL